MLLTRPHKYVRVVARIKLSKNDPIEITFVNLVTTYVIDFSNLFYLALSDS